MARFGQGFLQALTQPSYGQGLFELGGAIGGTRAANAGKKAKQEAMTLVNEALASNDPTKLLKAAQAISPYDPQTAVKLATAANTATKQRKQAQMASLEAAGSESTKKAQMARAIKMARDAKDALGLQQLSSGTIEPAAYINSLVERQRQAQGKEAKTFNMPPGSVLIDESGREIYKAPFKPAEASKPPTPKFSTVKTDNEVLSFKNGQLIARIPIGDATEEQTQVSLSTINKTSELLDTVASAKNKLNKAEDDFFNTAEGLTGQVFSGIGGTTAFSLRNNEYQTLAGQEAMREIGRLKEEAEKVGSRGTGLGQITQVEFSALQSNLAALNTGLSFEDQMQSLNKIERNLRILQGQAAGEDIIDLIDFNQPSYVSSGYIKKDGVLFYYPNNSDKEYYYNRTSKKFEPIQ